MGVTTTWTDLGAAWLLTYALHSTLLLGGVWLTTHLLGRLRGGPQRTLATQEALWKTALLGGLVTATLQLGLGWQPALGGWQLTAPGAEIVHGSSTPTSPQASPDRPAPQIPSSAFSWPVSEPSRPEIPGPASTRLPHPSASSAPLSGQVSRGWTLAGLALPRWTAAVTWLWLLGALALAGSLALSYHAFCRRIRNRSRLVGGDVKRLFDRLEPERAVGRPVDLSASSRLQSPLAKGVTRPEICLPVRVLSELAVQQQETLLAHELGHLVRRDPAWLLVARTIESVLFLQPLNRLARRRLQEISELRADDWAVTATGNPLDLARCLTRVADWNLAPVPVPSMAAKGSGLTRRVHRLLQSRDLESERRSKGLWLTVSGALLLVVLIAPGVTARGGAPKAQEPPAPPAPPTPSTAPAPSSASSAEQPLRLRPPRIAPIPQVPTPAPRVWPGPAPRLAWTAPPPPGEPGEKPDRDWEADALSTEEMQALEAEIAASLEEALAPLAEMQEEISAQIAEQLELELESLDVGLDTLDETLEGELENLGELLDEDDLVVDLSGQELSALRKEIEAMNAALLADLRPSFDLDLDLPMPEVEHLAQQSAEQAYRIAQEAHRLAQDGLSEEEAARLREQTRQLAEDMKPRREEMEHLAAEARRLAREAHERAAGENLELRERLRKQRQEQMEELRQKLEALREQRSEEREHRREELRQRLEAQREQMEGLRQQLREQQESRRDQMREQMRRRLEAQRQEMELHREQMRQQLDREREQRQQQIEELRREKELQRRQMENEPGEEPERKPEEKPPAAA